MHMRYIHMGYITLHILATANPRVWRILNVAINEMSFVFRFFSLCINEVHMNITHVNTLFIYMYLRFCQTKPNKTQRQTA